MIASSDSTDPQLSLSAAARSQPSTRGGRPKSPATILRWILHGLRGPNGQRLPCRNEMRRGLGGPQI